MSHPRVPSPPPPETLADAFRAATRLSDETKPPHSKIGSPASTLAHASSTPTSSSGSSGGLTGRRSHSGEILIGPDSVKSCPPGHRRSGSGPLIFAGSWSPGPAISSTGSSPVTNALPSGNICPSGRAAKPSLAPTPPPRSRTDILGSGNGHYGHGSIMRANWAGFRPAGTAGDASAMESSDPEEVSRAGNEQYRRGNFEEALKLYERAVAMCSDNAACRSNRAAALIGLHRFGEAVRECEEALRIDPGYARARQRLVSVFLRLGEIENAWRYLSTAAQQPDLLELHKLQTVEKHIGRCADSRKVADWRTTLRECEAAIAAGADSSPLLVAVRAEALLRLQQLDEANSAILCASKLRETSCASLTTKFCGFIADSYICFVHAQVDIALGRFENAISLIEKAKKLDSGNSEVATMLGTVEAVGRARALGNESFKSGKFADASDAYGEGLEYNLINPVLYCNRAACRFKLGQWEKCIEDCNEALRVQPSNTKARLRRAASYDKVERWAESVRDYEILLKELPGDTEVAEAHFHAQVALKTSRGEKVSDMKFGGKVEAITSIDQFQTAIALPGVSVVHFMASMNQSCSQLTPFFNALCTRFPSLKFLKVDVNEAPSIAKLENVRTVPTFKIFKNGTRIKEMICPSQQLLEYSMRRYGF